jgi:lipoprotein-anchoring transpeptidase ErfK/SrfK
VLFPDVTVSAGPASLRAVLTDSLGATWNSPLLSVYSWGVPGAPTLPLAANSIHVSPLAVTATAGSSTATMSLLVDGVPVRAIACAPGARAAMGPIVLHKGANVIRLVATSLTGTQTAIERTVRRREWPYATCLVVDKSDFRLYWVKNQQLIKSYKIAHGRHNWTPVRTWKILAKYKTNPRSVYGPRKMRMFKRVGRAGHYRYVFTPYAIHGTNDESSVGHQASHGCIRMYNRDVLELWPQVPLGTWVVTRA